MLTTHSKTLSPAYLVEGDLEQMFVQSICPKLPVRKIGCNGDQVCLTEIARRIGTQARLLQRTHRPLIIVFDREGRQASCEEIERDLRRSLETEDIRVPLLIGIADREVESWILADFENFCVCSGCEAKFSKISFEGKSGKSKIKRLLPRGKSYVETLDGVLWLKKCRPHKIAQRSPSFARFLDLLKPIDCWWTRQPKRA